MIRTWTIMPMATGTWVSWRTASSRAGCGRVVLGLRSLGAFQQIRCKNDMQWTRRLRTTTKVCCKRHLSGFPWFPRLQDVSWGSAKTHGQCILCRRSLARSTCKCARTLTSSSLQVLWVWLALPAQMLRLGGLQWTVGTMCWWARWLVTVSVPQQTASVGTSVVWMQPAMTPPTWMKLCQMKAGFFLCKSTCQERYL